MDSSRCRLENPPRFSRKSHRAIPEDFFQNSEDGELGDGDDLGQEGFHA